MGTAIFCFVISGLSLAGMVRILVAESDATVGTFAAMPFAAGASIWFIAGMLFVWLQRIRDAIARQERPGKVEESKPKPAAKPRVDTSDRPEWMS